MIITCPNCHTKYQVAQKTIGSAGRKVMCASCNQPWRAIAEFEQSEKPFPKPKLVEEPKLVEKDDDHLFDEKDEAELDANFENQEKLTKEKTNIIAQNNKRAEDKEVNKKDLKKDLKKEKEAQSDFTQSKQQKEMQKRQNAIAKKFPLRRFRQNFRYFVFFVLFAIIVGGFTFRTSIVRVVPQFAPIYEIIGLKINIFGLEFKDVKTLRSHNDGVDKMLISAKISNVTKKIQEVPMVVVSILDKNNVSLLQWNVSPKLNEIGAGESINFETQLNLIPVGANQVKLAFSNEWYD